MIDVVVASRKNDAQGICSYELASVDNSALPGFSAGVHIDGAD
jgi:vanillate O-demethylase ferredoxin subunit